MTFPSPTKTTSKSNPPGPRLRLVGSVDHLECGPMPTVVSPLGRSRRVQELFDRHYDRVVLFLRRLTSAEQADDLAQEVFFRLLQVKNLESREMSIGYLFRIAENLVRKRYHRERRHQRASEELRYRSNSLEGLETCEREPAVGAAGGGDVAFVGSKALHRAMEVLTENEQAAIRLIICRGLSYDQAARSLGVSVSTINNWKHRGVKKLRRVIDEARFESPECGDGGGDHPT